MIEQLEDRSVEPNPSKANVAVVDPPVAPGVPILGAAPKMLGDAPGFVLRTTRELGPRTLTLIAHPDDLRRVLQEELKDSRAARSSTP